MKGLTMLTMRISLIMMMMSNALEVEQLVLLVCVCSRNRINARKGQRLPAQAKNNEQCDETSDHASMRLSAQIKKPPLGAGQQS